MGDNFPEEKQDEIAAMLYVRLCTLCARRVPGHAYVRVEFPAMRPLGMLLMQGFQFNIIMLSWIVGIFCVTHRRTLCVSESQMGA